MLSDRMWHVLLIYLLKIRYPAPIAVMIWSVWSSLPAPGCMEKQNYIIERMAGWLTDMDSVSDPRTACEQPPQANSSHSNPDTDVGLTLELAANNPLQSPPNTWNILSRNMRSVTVFCLCKQFPYHLYAKHACLKSLKVIIALLSGWHDI